MFNIEIVKKTRYRNHFVSDPLFSLNASPEESASHHIFSNNIVFGHDNEAQNSKPPGSNDPLSSRNCPCRRYYSTGVTTLRVTWLIRKMFQITWSLSARAERGCEALLNYFWLKLKLRRSQITIEKFANVAIFFLFACFVEIGPGLKVNDNELSN